MTYQMCLGAAPHTLWLMYVLWLVQRITLAKTEVLHHVHKLSHYCSNVFWHDIFLFFGFACACNLDVIYLFILFQGSYSYRLPADDVLQGGNGPKTNVDSLKNTIIASTLLGSIMTFVPLSRYQSILLVILNKISRSVVGCCLAIDWNLFSCMKERQVYSAQAWSIESLKDFMVHVRILDEFLLKRKSFITFNGKQELFSPVVLLRYCRLSQNMILFKVFCWSWPILKLYFWEVC